DPLVFLSCSGGHRALHPSPTRRSSDLLGQTQTKLEQRAESTARMRAVSTFLRRHLEQANPVLLFQFGVPAGRYFYGSDQELIWRSEEHTSELQSRENLVCRLLLEKENI